MTITKREGIALALALGLGLLLGGLFFSGGRDEHKHDHSHEHADHGENKGEVWTCSMHPQIRQDEPGKCPLCEMDLIPASSMGDHGEANLQMSEAALSLAQIQSTVVKKAAGKGSLSLQGKMQVNEEKKRSLTAKFPGRIEKLFINFRGQAIRKGERIASLYSPELLRAQQELLESYAIREEQPALYRATKEKLRFWKLSEAQIENLQSREAADGLLDIYADISGIVSERLVNEGDYLSTGSSLARLSDLSSLWLVLEAYEKDLPFIKKGATLRFSTLAEPDKIHSTQVDYIHPQVNAQSRTVEIRALVANAGLHFFPEMIAHAELDYDIKTEQSLLSIPRSAVLWTGKQSLVYVQQPGTEPPSYELREVTLGGRMDDQYLILEGLKEGEKVISQGAFALDASAQLKGIESMISYKSPEKLEVAEDFLKEWDQLLQNYFRLKNHLVSSESGPAQESAKKALSRLANMPEANLEKEAKEYWSDLKKGLESSLKRLSQSSELDKQREAFEGVSDHFIEGIERMGTSELTVYQQFCPMAFEDAGAFWLSEEEEVLNPYFGSEMLRCGEVKQVFGMR